VPATPSGGRRRRRFLSAPRARARAPGRMGDCKLGHWVPAHVVIPWEKGCAILPSLAPSGSSRGGESGEAPEARQGHAAASPSLN
jgi:hypothetical protein